jgi:hypothetical protein
LIITSTRHELKGAISRLGAAPITWAERADSLDRPSAFGPFPDLSSGRSSVVVDSESRLLETSFGRAFFDTES